MIFHQNLRSYGLHDEASSVRLYSIPAHCSVFLFEHSNFGGRFTRITGDVSGKPVEVSSLGGHMNDRLSSVLVVNNGLSSVRISANDLTSAAESALEGFNVSGVSWDGTPQVYIEPRRRLLVYLRGTIQETWPDSYLKLTVYFRLYMTSAARINAAYDGYYAKFGGSLAGYANNNIKGLLRSFFRNSTSQANLVLALDQAFADRLAPLRDTGTLGIALRRLNFLPGELELVLSDDSNAMVTLLPGGSTNRPAGQVTTGSV